MSGKPGLRSSWRVATASVLVALAASGCLGAAAPSARPSATPTIATSTAGPPSASNPTPSAGPTSCPPPATVDVLGGWSPDWPLADVVRCVGSRPLTVVGYFAPPWGIGGTGNGLAPVWLADWAGLPSVLWLRPRPTTGCISATDCIWMFVFAPEPGALPLAPDRWVTVTGHFDDPAAPTCHWVGPEGSKITASQAATTCREHFVVTAVTDAPAP